MLPLAGLQGGKGFFFGQKGTKTFTDRDQIWTTGRDLEAHRF